MNQSQYTGWSDPRVAPALPPRPTVGRTSSVESGSTSALDAAKALMTAWNAWADQTDSAFEIMQARLKHFEVLENDYIGLIQFCIRLPTRPKVKLNEMFESLSESADNDAARIRLRDLKIQWETLADIYETLAKELSWHRVRVDGTQEMLNTTKGDLDFSKLSLTAGSSDKHGSSSILGSAAAPEQSAYSAYQNNQFITSLNDLNIE